MKIIEAMKLIKDLQRKASDLRGKVAKHCAISSVQNPTYDDQTKQVSEWVQAHTDIVQEICDLRFAIQRTNIMTPVTIELGGKQVEKTIAQWIHRRRDLASLDSQCYRQLNDRGIVEGKSRTPEGDVIEIKINRFFSPEVRDKMLDMYDSEPSKIDAKLEVINAVTDVVDYE